MTKSPLGGAHCNTCVCFRSKHVEQLWLIQLLIALYRALVKQPVMGKFRQNNGGFGRGQRGKMAMKDKRHKSKKHGSFQPFRKKRPLIESGQQKSKLSKILSELDTEVVQRSKLGRRAPTAADLQRWEKKKGKQEHNQGSDDDKPSKSKNTRWKKAKKKDEDDTELEVVPSDFKAPTFGDTKPDQEYDSDSDEDNTRVTSHEENSDSNDELSDTETRAMVMEQRKKKAKSGGFQSMGLSQSVLKAILRKGYKVPTPIQRKAMPLIMQGVDVVAMARTGSGKTAAFLVPMYEKLKAHSAKSGARALILSPTRELALQTYKFAREFGRFTDLNITLILGGDKMEKQFEALHSSPDIIIATPGRLLHVLVEMSLKLTEVEYVVFDEADRLFEMGFAEQLKEILNRLPEHRQTLLFSATLPQLLVDFAKAGLHDPQVVRLDVEHKLSEDLKTAYFYCRDQDKDAILVHLLKNVIPADHLTVVFVATRHHVEYLKELFRKQDIACTYAYSSLDQEARRDNVQRFRSKKANVLLVTDVAARGIDIPLLDYVINYNFPAKSKLFVHRVGRVARAGRSGVAYSLVTFDELPYFEQLQLFLDRPVKLASNSVQADDDSVIGTVPQTIIDEEAESIISWTQNVHEIASLKKVCANAYKQYIKSRPPPSAESVRKVRALPVDTLPPHPLLTAANKDDREAAEVRTKLLSGLKNYKTAATIFEINANRKSSEKSTAFEVMQNKRKVHEKVIEKKKQQNAPEAETSFKDKNFYLDYQSSGAATEDGLKLETSAHLELDHAAFDVLGDDAEGMKRRKDQVKWDRKKKKFVRESGSDDPKKKKIKTESGAWIPASYKSDLYKKWKEGHKVDVGEEDSDEDMAAARKQDIKVKKQKGTGRAPKSELKTKEQIFKQRQKDERIKKIRQQAQEKKGPKGSKGQTSRGQTSGHKRGNKFGPGGVKRKSKK